jgi:RNA polymerase sigma factor (sigma-70 family)
MFENKVCEFDKELQLFDEFYVKEYKYLRTFSKSINPSADYESLLHDCYLKCRDRIEVNGYLGTDYLNFVRVTIINTYKSNYRAGKRKQMVDFEDPNYYNTIEDILSLKDQQEEQETEREHRNIYLNTIIFEYIETVYSPKEIFVFKTYYLLKHKHLNYKTLSEMTGYSITSVSNIIKKMKKDIRLNLISYIFSGQTVNI